MREGALPEETVYEDTGCDLAPHCLDCPIPACRYDLGPGEARRIQRMLTIDTLLAQGQTYADAAAALGVSERTVRRLDHRMKGT